MSEGSAWIWLVPVIGSLTVLALVAPGAPDFWRGVLVGFGAVVALTAVAVAGLHLVTRGRPSARAATQEDR